jgi:hypothetical protein
MCTRPRERPRNGFVFAPGQKRHRGSVVRCDIPPPWRRPHGGHRLIRHLRRIVSHRRHCVDSEDCEDCVDCVDCAIDTYVNDTPSIAQCVRDCQGIRLTVAFLATVGLCCRAAVGWSAIRSAGLPRQDRARVRDDAAGQTRTLGPASSWLSRTHHRRRPLTWFAHSPGREVAAESVPPMDRCHGRAGRAPHVLVEGPLFGALIDAVVGAPTRSGRTSAGRPGVRC